MRLSRFALVFLSILTASICTLEVNLSLSNGLLVLAATADARKVEADRLFNQGIQQYQASEFEVALQSWQQALSLYRETNNKLKIAVTLNQLGTAYFSYGKYPEAKTFHEQSLTIANEIGSDEEKAKSLNGLGNALTFLSQQGKAIFIHEQALSIAKKTGLKEEEVKSLNGLGNAYLTSQKTSQAIKLYEQSLNLAKNIGDKEGQAKALTNLGNVYQNLKKYEKAIALREQSLAIIRTLNDRRIEAVTLVNLGEEYTILGRYQKAIEYNKQALGIYTKLGNKQGQMFSLIGLGVAYRNIEQYEKAIEFNLKSLAIAVELGDTLQEAVSYGNLGVSNYFLGRYQKSVEFQEMALNMYKKLKFQEGIGLTLGNLGLDYSSLGEYKKAIGFYQQSLAIARKLGDTFREGNALNNIGRDYISLGEYANASTTLLEAINVYESIRLSGLSDTNKISIFDTYSRSYRLLQKAFILQNKLSDALETAERGRARNFVELLSSRLTSDSKQQLPINPPSIEQIKQIATTQKATLVEYSIVGSELYIWVVKRTGEVTFRKSDLNFLWQQEHTTLEALVRSTRNESIGVGYRGFGGGGSTESRISHPENLQQLHKLLIEPIADLLPNNPNDRVIFIPQASLFLVPFAALQDTSGKYLIEKHTILTAPSIQILDLTHQQRQRVAGIGALVMGNPTMPSYAPPGKPPEQLQPLPYSGDEAKAIAPILHTTAITGSLATKSTIVSKMTQAGIIHLATHGLLDDVKGLGVPGAIALAPSGQDDGLLRADEIFDLKLNAELVVLSACDTGRGTITGDGVIGLSRSLISAGVPSVIVSLWSVPDGSTSELMTEFYKNLLNKPDKAAALRGAMLTTMKQHKSPKYWAAFTLIGESE